jgi:hypothetical protein
VITVRALSLKRGRSFLKIKCNAAAGEADYEKKDKMCYMVSDIGFYIGGMYRKAECAGAFSIV